MAGLLKVVSPEGILHFVLDETTAKGDFCRAHGLRPAYFNKYVIKAGTETNGWQLLENIKYLQHASGAIVVVVGKPKQFLDAREAACLRAGLASDAMPFTPNNTSELRQFERLLHPGNTVKEKSGWKCIEAPPIVRTVMANVACAACGCSAVDLFLLLNRLEQPAQSAAREAVLRAQQELSDATKIAQHRQAELAEAEAALESKRLAVKMAEDQLAAHLGGLRQEGRSHDGLSGASGSDAAVAEPATRAFDQICDLDRSKFQPMSDFSFSTWRQALARPLAHAAVITPEMLGRLYDTWDATRGAFEATGANSLQFIAFIERVLPYEFNLLAHAALGVERHRLAESCMGLPLPSGANMLPELAQRLTARILMSITGTSSQREREDCETLTSTYLRNRFNGSMMREICILHSLEPKLLLSLQTHLGIAVRAAVNVSELTQYLLSFQIVPNEELSRQWLLNVQEGAQENRIRRLIEWMKEGDGWTLRFDNCDVGKLLHFVALIATRDRAPPPSPFPFGPPSPSPVPPRSTCPPALLSLDLEHFEPHSASEVAAQASWWAFYDAAAASIDRRSAAGASTISRAALLRRTKGGLATSIIHSARALGPALECQALGTPPTAMDVDACGEGRRKRDRPQRPRGAFDLRQVRDTLLSPPRRSARAICDYKPSVHLPSAIAVSERQLLTLLACEPHDTICLVRDQDGNVGHLPTYIIGQGDMVQPEDRELWELALVESTELAPAPNRMELARRLLVLPGQRMEESALDLNHANGYSQYNKWTRQATEVRKARRREARIDEDEEGDEEDDSSDDGEQRESDEEDYAPSHGSSDGSSAKSADEGSSATPPEPSAPEPSPKRPKATGCPPSPHRSTAATTQSPAPQTSLPFNRQVRGKFSDSLVYIAPVLQKATDLGVTQACMSVGRLLLDDLRTRDEQLWASLSKVQKTLSCSADQQFHANEWAARERMLKSLVAQREQKRRGLDALIAKGGLEDSVRTIWQRHLDSLDAEMTGVFDETFDLGVMHAVIYLQRSAFQICPDLLDRLIFEALPGLERVKSHIVEVKEGYWLLVQLLFGRLLVAWRALRADLCSKQSIESLRANSVSFALYEFVMETLVMPSVMLADAARGRTIAGELQPESACPLVLASLKHGLQLLLLSGRHHLYVDCFGREIRAKLLLSDEKFAWWANNLWVRLGGANYFNDETVERFLIKVLKRDMEGGHFTDREAARSAATVEALQMVREELRAMVGGVRPDKLDQASAAARRLQQQPAVAAALLLTIESRLGSVITRELAVSRQLELASRECSFKLEPPIWLPFPIARSRASC